MRSEAKSRAIAKLIIIVSGPYEVVAEVKFLWQVKGQKSQEAQLSQRDLVMHYVSWNLVNCCTCLPRILFEKVCDRWMSWRLLNVIRIVTAQLAIYDFLLAVCYISVSLLHPFPRYYQLYPKIFYRGLFCSLAVFDPRVGHTMDVPSPVFSVLCYFDWLFYVLQNWNEKYSTLISSARYVGLAWSGLRGGGQSRPHKNFQSPVWVSSLPSGG